MNRKKSLGEILKEVRKENRLTQEDVSKALYMSRRTLMRIENDQTEPTIELLSRMSDLYKTDLLSLTYEMVKFENSSAIWLIQELENMSINSNYSTMKEPLEKLKAICEKTPESLNLVQYYYTYEGFYYYNSSERDLEAAIESLNKALTIYIKDFDIKKYKEFTYSDIEIRALAALSMAYEKKGYDIHYNEIIEFAFKSLNEINSTYFIIGNQYGASLTIQSRFDESIKLVDDIIEKAKNYNFQVFFTPTLPHKLYELRND